MVAVAGDDHGVGQDGLLSDEVASPTPSTLEHRYSRDGYSRGSHMVGYSRGTTWAATVGVPHGRIQKGAHTVGYSRGPIWLDTVGVAHERTQ